MPNFARAYLTRFTTYAAVVRIPAYVAEGERRALRWSSTFSMSPAMPI